MLWLVRSQKILDSYAGPNKLDPKTSESCMLAVNSVNACPYCTSLHGELGRMAGLEEKGSAINSAKSGSGVCVCVCVCVRACVRALTWWPAPEFTRH